MLVKLILRDNGMKKGRIGPKNTLNDLYGFIILIIKISLDGNKYF